MIISFDFSTLSVCAVAYPNGPITFKKSPTIQILNIFLEKLVLWTEKEQNWGAYNPLYNCSASGSERCHPQEFIRTTKISSVIFSSM